MPLPSGSALKKGTKLLKPSILTTCPGQNCRSVRDGFCLKLVLLELFDVAVDLLQLFRDVDALRAVGHALAASDAAGGLTELRDCPVVADQVGPSCLAVICIVPACGQVSFVHALVVVQEEAQT